MDVASPKPGCVPDTTRFFITSGTFSPGHGFTLIELIVSIAIISLLASYAIPSFKRLVEGQRKVTCQNALASALYMARSQAVIRNSEIVVCKSDGQRCITSGTWEQGWLVFEDQNGDRAYQDTEAVFAKQEAFSGLTVYYNAFGSNNYLVYYPQGITKTNGTYTFCDPEASVSTHALIVYKTGRARASTTSSDGSPLSCPP